MHGPNWAASLSSASLFWRVFALNGVVYLVGVVALVLSSLTLSSPMLPAELFVLFAGLAVMLAMNAYLIRLALAPLEQLKGMMATIDLLHPGQRLPQPESRELAPVAQAFNEMIERLESERAASSAQALSAQESERRRVARELHDEVGQSLTAVLLELRRVTDTAPPSFRPMLLHARETARESLADVRRIAQRLRPETLEQLGLAAALTELVNEFGRSTSVSVRKELCPPPGLTDDVEVAIYRVAQECLTNVARHASARNVQVTLASCEDRTTRLVVRDDGRGFRGREGGGIRGMHERALLVHGDLRITCGPARGTEVSLSIPSDRGAP